MIFNTWACYPFFLVPSAILFRLSPPSYRPWVIVAGGSAFFLYFSYTELGGIIPAACLGIFLWESITSRFYWPKSWFCWAGVAQAIVLLFTFRYWNFFAGLVWFRAPEQHYWGARFFATGNFVFHVRIHPLRHGSLQRQDRSWERRPVPGIHFVFSEMVAGPIKRYQQFLPKLRADPAPWPNDWHEYQGHLHELLAKQNIAVVDASRWFPDANKFGDALHLNEQGAKEFSHRLGASCGNVNQPNSCGN